MTFAIIRSGGKQHHVSVGSKVQLERLDVAEGGEVSFDEVLLASTDKGTTVGQPLVAGSTVKAKVLRHYLGNKIRIIKSRRRKHSQTRLGHRQQYTEVEVLSIDS